MNPSEEGSFCCSVAVTSSAAVNFFEQPFLNWEISDLCGHFLVLKEEVNTYSQFDPH